MVYYSEVITDIRVMCFALLLPAFSFRATAEDFTNALRAYLQQCVHAEIPNGCIVIGLVDEQGSQYSARAGVPDSAGKNSKNDRAIGQID